MAEGDDKQVNDIKTNGNALEMVEKQPKIKKPGGATGHGFQPGQSGNPKGRPKGRVELGNYIRRFLSELDPADVDALKKKKIKKCDAKTRLDTLVQKLADEDPRTLLAYGYGKPVETVEIGEIGEADNEKPLDLAPKRLNEVVTWLDKNAPRHSDNGN